MARPEYSQGAVEPIDDASGVLGVRTTSAALRLRLAPDVIALKAKQETV